MNRKTALLLAAAALMSSRPVFRESCAQAVRDATMLLDEVIEQENAREALIDILDPGR